MSHTGRPAGRRPTRNGGMQDMAGPLLSTSSLPLFALHAMSRKSPQLIELFIETESSDGRLVKFLSGKVSQRRAGPSA